MNTDDQDRSLGDAATFAGSSKRRSADASLGDERTLGGGDATGIDTVFDDIEVIDLTARYKTEGTLGRGGATNWHAPRAPRRFRIGRVL